jgi:preprotein translocase subunit SecE
MVQYGPFVDFLIATEAEMKKVSWTSKEDLYKATIVVLVTVAILATYLFLVDKLWVFLLELLGVLKFRSTGFGANA